MSVFYELKTLNFRKLFIYFTYYIVLISVRGEGHVFTQL